MIVRTRSCARAGLLGNPSDGYFGRTLSFSFTNFAAEVELTESPKIRFEPGPNDGRAYEDADALLTELASFGYYGGLRLLKATSRLFFEHCREQGLKLAPKNFTARYSSTIPRLVGLGGSSALCTAMFLALMRFYEVEVARERSPTLCRLAETRELHINAGLQDRVIQVYDGLVAMDFDKALLDSRGYGGYRSLPPELLPPVYVAYDERRAEQSGIYHQSLRALSDKKDPGVTAAMRDFAALARAGVAALESGRPGDIAALVDGNFDLRASLFQLSEANLRMVKEARAAGASAKFAGSGGAIVGTYEGPAMLAALTARLGAIGCAVVVPTIPPTRE